MGKRGKTGPSSLHERTQGQCLGLWGAVPGGVRWAGPAGALKGQKLPVQGDPTGLQGWDPLGGHCCDAPGRVSWWLRTDAH